MVFNFLNLNRGKQKAELQFKCKEDQLKLFEILRNITVINFVFTLEKSNLVKTLFDCWLDKALIEL